MFMMLSRVMKIIKYIQNPFVNICSKIGPNLGLLPPGPTGGYLIPAARYPRIFTIRNHTNQLEYHLLLWIPKNTRYTRYFGYT